MHSGEAHGLIYTGRVDAAVLVSISISSTRSGDGLQVVEEDASYAPVLTPRGQVEVLVAPAQSNSQQLLLYYCLSYCATHSLSTYSLTIVSIVDGSRRVRSRRRLAGTRRGNAWHPRRRGNSALGPLHLKEGMDKEG